MRIVEVVKRIVEGHRYSSGTYVEYLKKIGVKIGEHIEIFFPNKTHIDNVNPHLLEIGSYVSMTGPVTILTHDYSVCVTKKAYNGRILGKQNKTIIGNNVFLGWGCCILPGTVIGDNVIIGAGAVVSGKVDSNSVYGGNPAKKICTLDEFYNKRIERQLEEAIIIFHEYKKKNGVKPPLTLFHEYFFLFSGGENDLNNLIPEFASKFYDHGNYEETKNAFIKNVPMFGTFEEFVEYAESIEVKNG